MNRFVNGAVYEVTQEEIAAMQDEQARAEAEEAHRTLSDSEVAEIFIRAQINTVEIDDHISVRMMRYYPSFEDIIGQTIKKPGYKFTYGSKLWKTAQANLTIQEHYLPGDGTESLYTRIDEEHLGNKYDPIPYDGNMALVNGLYYMQDYTVYLCVRDTGNPVYNALSELVGLYVEAV